MKSFSFKTISTIILILAFLGMNAQNKGYHIKVTIENADDSLCYLAGYYGDKQILKDTAYPSSKGVYVLKGDTVLEKGIYILAGEKKNRYFEFVLNKDQHFTMETVKSDPVESMKIKGSEENDIFYDYMKFLASKQREMRKLQEKLKNTSKKKEKKELDRKIAEINENVIEYQHKVVELHKDKFISAFINASLNIEVPNPPKELNDDEKKKYRYYYYKNHYWDNIDLSNSGLVRTPFFHQKLETYFEKVLVQSPDTIINAADKLIEETGENTETFKYIVWYVTSMSERSKIMGFDKIFVHMAEKYYVSGKAFWASDALIKSFKDRAEILERLLIGAKAPDLVMVDTTYKKVSVYGTKADYLLVYFYDPDCGHCKKEMAKLKPFYKKYKDHGVEVFAVFSASDVEAWKKYLKKNKLKWINAINGYNIDYHELYDIISTPTIYLLDKDKRIIAKRLSAEQVIRIVKEKMGEDPAEEQEEQDE